MNRDFLSASLDAKPSRLNQIVKNITEHFRKIIVYMKASSLRLFSIITRLTTRPRVESGYETDAERRENFNLNRKLPKRKLRLVYFVIVIILIVGAYALLRRSAAKALARKTNLKISDTRIQNVPTVVIGKDFDFDAINVDKKKVRIKFALVQAERKSQIKVKGEERSISGDQDYLLLRIELTNDTTEKLAFATVDYVRLKADDDKLFAPDFHNGNVVIDPLSVRKDLLAFVVNKSGKSFMLSVGELSGEKQVVEVKF